MQERYPLSVGLYLNSFQISCDLSRICSSKTSHAPSSQDSVQKDTICLFSAKRPLTCLLQQNILSEESFQKKNDITQLSLQRNHKFPLHSSFIQTISFSHPVPGHQGLKVRQRISIEGTRIRLEALGTRTEA